MGTKEKLIERFKRLPKDFTWDELVRLMCILGFECSNKGKTSGSRIEFIRKRDKRSVILHKPHPGNIVKGYALKLVYDKLVALGLFND